MLVGHPLTALERELKRLVVREELEKEQLRIIKESGLSSKDVSFWDLRGFHNEVIEVFEYENHTFL